jgi:predicted RNA-binding Zn-ribbon protein involved in translation (DUF1610 family)
MSSKLMLCKSCGKEISRKAEACPHCGHAYVKSIAKRLETAQTIAVVIFSLIVVGLLFLFAQH